MATKGILEHRSTILSTFASTFKLTKEEVWHTRLGKNPTVCCPLCCYTT